MGAGQDIPGGGCSWRHDLPRQLLSHIFPKLSPTPTCARSSRDNHRSGFLCQKTCSAGFHEARTVGETHSSNSRSLTSWSKAAEPALIMSQKVQSCQPFEKKNLER
ncbi:hypothetical protein ACRRTK_018390 [Alexandromys fortis]